MVKATLDAQNWAAVPFHFWTVVMFVFGSMVGSFLNVCIYRMPLGLSVVSPPSHCPKCKYSIPAYLNIPLFTWMILRGRCRNCRDLISPRYFLVELLTAVLFASSWLGFGGQSVGTALVYCLVLAGLVAARIDANELWVDIAIEPVKAVEFIYIPLRIKATGAISNSQTPTQTSG